MWKGGWGGDVRHYFFSDILPKDLDPYDDSVNAEDIPELCEYNSDGKHLDFSDE